MRNTLATIHIAKKELAMDDETYRAMLQNIAGVRSAKDLTPSKAGKVLAHLERCGFKVRSKNSRTLARDPESKKVRALWLFLHELGVVKNPSEAALAAYVKRMTGVDALQWGDSEQAEKLIETLKKWAMRHLPGAIEKQLAQLRELQVALTEDERGQLNYLLKKAFERTTYDPMAAAWDELDRLIKKGMVAT